MTSTTINNSGSGLSLLLRAALCVITILARILRSDIPLPLTTAIVAWAMWKIVSEQGCKITRTEFFCGTRQEEHRSDCCNNNDKEKECKNGGDEEDDDCGDWDEEAYLERMDQFLVSYREVAAYHSGMQAAAVAIATGGYPLPSFPTSGASPLGPIYYHHEFPKRTTPNPKETRDQMRRRVAREMKRAADAATAAASGTIHSSRTNIKKQRETKTEMRRRVAREMKESADRYKKNK